MQEGKRLWGGKPSALGRQERIGGDAQDPVVMEASPTAALVVLQRSPRLTHFRLPEVGQATITMAVVIGARSDAVAVGRRASP